MTPLQKRIEAILEHPERTSESQMYLEAFLDALEKGTIRASEPDPASPTGWRVNGWVKQAILLGFRWGVIEPVNWGGLRFVDKHFYPPRTFGVEDGIRIVPGGTAVRRGACLKPGVVVMPPSYVNVGAYVGEGTMIDSHVLVGSCAQIGARVHLSAGCQIGGVLEPIGALPVIVEEEAFIGGCTGIFEGTIVKSRAVIGAGVVLTHSTRIYDLVHERVIQAEGDNPLVVPEGAVVVPGSRPAQGAFAQQHQIHLYTPVIVKYRNAKTSATIALEDALRG